MARCLLHVAAMRIVAILACLGADAAADPCSCPCPARAEPTSTALLPSPDLDLAARAGALASSRSLYSWLPGGGGPFAELEAGAHWPHVILAVTGSIARLHDTSIEYDVFDPPDVDASATVLGAGLRARAEYRGAFAGIGVRYELWLESATLTSPTTMMRQHVTEHEHDLALELHAGYTLPIQLGRVRPQLLAAYTNGDATTWRLALGVIY